MTKYKVNITELKSEIFPSHFLVCIQAIENSTNLIRLFRSKTQFLDNKLSKEEQKEIVDNFAIKFFNRVNSRNDYQVIEYHNDLKFIQYKKKHYSNHLLDFNGKRRRNI